MSCRPSSIATASSELKVLGDQSPNQFDDGKTSLMRNHRYVPTPVSRGRARLTQVLRIIRGVISSPVSSRWVTARTFFSIGVELYWSPEVHCHRRKRCSYASRAMWCGAHAGNRLCFGRNCRQGQAIAIFGERRVFSPRTSLIRQPQDSVGGPLAGRRHAERSRLRRGRWP
jgi:hypothetical protein